MMTKGYSTAGVLRRFLSISPLLSAFVALGISACAPKNQDKSKPSEIEELVTADESIKHSDIQGVWVLESVTKNKKVIFQSDKGFVTTGEEAKNLFGSEIDNSAKALIAFKITDSKLQMMIFGNGTLRGRTEDEYQFDKTKLQVDYNGNKNFNSRQIILQRFGSNILMAEKTWRVIIRKITEQELDDLLKMPTANINGTGTIQPQQPKPATNETNVLKDVANELIGFHEKLYGKSILSTFDSKTEGLQPNELRGLKEQVERALTNSEIIYDSNSDTLGHIVYQNELQCYSGTTLLIVTALKKFTQEQWENLNMVAIHTSGHVLPGFVVPESGKFRLYGIEMTSSDDGLVDFGITDQLKVPVRVVDALSWAKIEANPNKTQPDMIKQAQTIIESIHKKYQIPMLPVTPCEGSGKSKLNASPFAFGKIPPDRRERRLSKQPTAINYGNSAGNAAKTAKTHQVLNTQTHENTSTEVTTKQNVPQIVRQNNEGWVAKEMVAEKHLSPCELAASLLEKETWNQMEFDLHNIYDIKTDNPLSEEDLRSRNLNTTIGFLRPNVKFRMDKEAKLLYYISHDENEKVIKRAFKIMKDDSTCVVGIDSMGPSQELRDFASGTVAIEINPEKLQGLDGLRFNMIWNNQFFKQKGFLNLY